MYARITASSSVAEVLHAGELESPHACPRPSVWPISCASISAPSAPPLRSMLQPAPSCTTTKPSTAAWYGAPLNVVVLLLKYGPPNASVPPLEHENEPEILFCGSLNVTALLPSVPLFIASLPVWPAYTRLMRLPVSLVHTATALATCA